MKQALLTKEKQVLAYFQHLFFVALIKGLDLTTYLQHRFLIRQA